MVEETEEEENFLNESRQKCEKEKLEKGEA